ncbi:uncharacterized protein [Mytilus edulis]|uniref:uncharacterized protein n=1 Tax=Mytilus edulis TaxID=6550 RepID=UPI0039EEBB09
MIWTGDEIPKDWNKGLIVKIVKKGDRPCCDNYKAITLLSVPSKVFTKIIIQRIQEGINEELRQGQAGFRRGKVMRMNTTHNNPVKLNEKDLEDVDTFTYLGEIVTTKGGCDNDMDNRLKKAKGQFSRLRKIWRSSVLSFKTKVRLFNSLVTSVLLYGCETWKTTEQDKKKLNTFQNRCLRQILKIIWLIQYPTKTVT